MGENETLTKNLLGFFLVTQLHSAIEAMPIYTFEELINKF